jgi:hypothetical protein
MSVTALPVAAPDPSTRAVQTSQPGTPGFEERWAAWQARGAARDRAVRRRMMFALPILAIVAAVLFVLLPR